MKTLGRSIIVAAFVFAVGCQPPERLSEMSEEDIPSPVPAVEQVEIASISDESEEILRARAQVAALRAALESAERDLDILLAELAVANEKAPTPGWQGGPSFRLNNVEEGSYKFLAGSIRLVFLSGH